MNKKDLIDLGIAEDVAEKVVILHGKGIESHKATISTMQKELDTAQGQLTEANTAIEGFKKLDPEGVKKAADEWKTKYEQAEKDFSAQLVAKDFERDLDSALVGAKARNTKAVKALLSIDELKDAGGKFIAERFNEQIEKIKPENDYQFADTKPSPKIVTGGNNQSINLDPFEAGLLKGAKLTSDEGK